MSDLIATPVVRLCWVAVFRGVNSPLAPTKFKKKVTCLFDKTNQEHEAFREEYLAKLAEAVRAQPLDLRGCSFRDGDMPGKQGKNAGKVDEVTKGHWLLTPWCDNDATPTLRYIDATSFHQATTAEHIYSGCYGRVSMRLFPYVKGSPGISLGLCGVLKIEDGPRLSKEISEDEIEASLGLVKQQLGTQAAAAGHGQGFGLYPEITDPAARAALGI